MVSVRIHELLYELGFIIWIPWSLLYDFANVSFFRIGGPLQHNLSVCHYDCLYVTM